MNILFVHQNFPGQYLHLAPHLARLGHRVVAVSSRSGVTLPGVQIVNYAVPPERAPATHRYLTKAEEAVLRGERVAAAALQLDADGFRPDIVCAHPGWGEALYLDDIWKGVPQLHYCEFFFAPFRAAAQFRKSDPVHLDQIFELRARNALALLSLDVCVAGVAPTEWQWSQYPAVYRPRIAIVHDGINVRQVRPDPAAVFTLPSGRRLSPGDPVVTYVSRNLEPTRGFPEFMRAAARLLERRHDVEIVVGGGDEVSYGPPLQGETWRERMLRELEPDRSRIHFLGSIPYVDYLTLLQVSAVHVYLTAPFVLSWSLTEAMAAGCLVVASDTAPVREVVSDGRSGLLFDFFDRDALVGRVEEALAGGRSFDAMRAAARQRIVDGYSLARCLPRQVALVEQVAARRSPALLNA
jgi:glycosyltransferase involved in cell wall biosynthesis